MTDIQLKQLLIENNKTLLKEIDKRFEQVDKGFEVQQSQINELRAEMLARFESADQKIDQQIGTLRKEMNERFDEVLDGITRTFGTVYELLDSKFRPRIERLEKRVFAVS